MFCCKGCYSESTKLIERVNEHLEKDLDVNTILDKLN